jgi:hypothetical protein
MQALMTSNAGELNYRQALVMYQLAWNQTNLFS